MVEDQVRPLKEGGFPQPQQVRAERVLPTHLRLRLDTRQHVQDHLRLELSAEMSSLRHVTAPSFRTHPSIMHLSSFWGALQVGIRRWAGPRSSISYASH